MSAFNSKGKVWVIIEKCYEFVDHDRDDNSVYEWSKDIVAVANSLEAADVYIKTKKSSGSLKYEKVCHVMFGLVADDQAGATEGIL